MKILFMGTPDFAAQCLKALCEDGTNEIVGVISQPDKPQGRHMELKPTAVKEYALSQGLNVYQPQTLKEGAIEQLLRDTAPELIAVVAYGKILPEYVLNFPKYGCVNIHGSLLPRFRGAAPIQRAVMAGDKVTGVTAMYMEKGLDTGDMIMKLETPIDEEETAGQVFDRLALMGGRLLVETVERFKQGDFSAQKQDEALSCYAPMLTKSEGEIDWSLSAEEIYNKVRGLNPWPLSYSFIDGKRFVVDFVKKTEGNGAAGQVLWADERGIAVACGSGAVLIESLKPEGKKKMPVSDFLRGHKIEAGVRLGLGKE